MEEYLKAILPYPISVNQVWLKNKSRVYLNPQVLAYRKEVWALLYNQPKFSWPLLKIDIKMYPPRTNCDIDNILKTLLDSLQHVGTIRNDVQIHELHVQKFAVRKPAFVEIEITEM